MVLGLDLHSQRDRGTSLVINGELLCRVAASLLARHRNLMVGVAEQDNLLQSSAMAEGRVAPVQKSKVTGRDAGQGRDVLEA
jgi:hypothetical protein